MSWYNPISWVQAALNDKPNNANPAAYGGPFAANVQPTQPNRAPSGATQSAGVTTVNAPSGFQNGQNATSAPGNTGATPGGQGSLQAGPSGGGGAAGSSAVQPAGTNTNGGSSTFLPLFNGAIGQLQGAYNNIFGSGGVLPQAQGQAAANIQQGYQSQLGNLGQQFQQAQTQLPWEYAARGAANSGWAGNAYNTAQNEFNNSQQAIQASQAKDLANIYQQGAGLQQESQAQLNAFNNPQFQAMLSNAPSYIQSEQYSTALQDLANLAYQQGANTPLTQALGGITSNPSYQQTGSANIKNQLQALSGSGAPSSVQNQIAQGIIGNPSNPTNTNFLNYWQSLQNAPQNPQIQSI